MTLKEIKKLNKGDIVMYHFNGKGKKSLEIRG